MSQLLADNALVRLIRGDSGNGDLILSMVGVKLGDRLLVLGLSDPGLLPTLGSKVGLTGRACGVDASVERVARTRRQAEREGVLVEVEAWSEGDFPFQSGSFDLVVVRAWGPLTDQAPEREAMALGRQLLRRGGRCLVLADGRPVGLQRFLKNSDTAADKGPALVQMLTGLGYRGPRILAERDGLLFVEAIFLDGADD